MTIASMRITAKTLFPLKSTTMLSASSADTTSLPANLKQMPATQAKLPFSLFFKPIGAQCNLNCRYCYYWNKPSLAGQSSEDELRSHGRIDSSILAAAIEQHIVAQPESNLPIEFIWHGGEPMLAGLGFYQNVIKVQARYLSQGKTQQRKTRAIKNTLQTNGVLISPQWAKFFADNGFMLGVSVDGPQKIHDLSRNDKKGRSSFERTMNGIKLLKTHQVEFNTLSVINNQTYSHGKEIYQFLKDYGSGYMQFQPCLDHQLDQRDEQNWSLTGKQWGKFLCSVFDEWCREDIGKIYVQFFENCLMILMGYPSQMCHHSATCGQQLAMEKDGAVYSCDHYVYPENALGRIHHSDMDASTNDADLVTQTLESIVNSTKQRAFGQMKSQTLSEQCKQCDFILLCQGGCPKYRTMENQYRHPHNVLCDGYQQFFKHALPTLIPMVSAMKNGYSAEYYGLFR